MTARKTIGDLVHLARLGWVSREMEIKEADEKYQAIHAEIQAEVLVKAVNLIEAERAADEALYRDEPARINRRVGMRQATEIVRRMCEPGPESSRRPRVRRPAADGKDTGGAPQALAGESTQAGPDLHSIVLAALSAGQGPVLPLPAHTARLLAARVTNAVRPLVPYRPVWDSSLPPGGNVCSICGEPVESEPCAEHAPTSGPFVPRTEREHWVDIADALNAAGAAGIAVGIDMEGILTDHLAWAVVWNRETERWEVGGYEDDSPEESPASAEDWVICCSPNPRCPNGERRDRAVERGWTQNGRAGNWLCAEHSPGFFQPGHTYTDSQFPQFGSMFRCESITRHPVKGERTALGWRRVRGDWEPCAYGEHDWDPEHLKGVPTATGTGEPRG